MYFDSVKYSWSLGHGVGGIQRYSLGPPTPEVFPRFLFPQSPPCADTFPSPHTPVTPQALSAPLSCLKGASTYMHRHRHP